MTAAGRRELAAGVYAPVCLGFPNFPDVGAGGGARLRVAINRGEGREEAAAADAR